MIVWKYQIRVNINDAFAEAARNGMNHPSLEPFENILLKHNMQLVNQFDAFVNYCAEAEASGQTDDPLYPWTKALVDNPAKKIKYATRFTFYANGGKDSVYDEAIADALVSDLQPIIDSQIIVKLSKISTDPAQNPQPPKRG